MEVLEAMKSRDNKETTSSCRFPSDLAAYSDRFKRFQEVDGINVLEIGVQGGGGIWCWRKFFPKAHNIVGIDVDDATKQHENASQNVFVCIGDQSDAGFLQRVHDAYGPFDIIIDDGGHHMHQHRASFDKLFPLLRDDGLYCIEDLHTSYWPAYGGGVDAPTSTINFFRGLVDALNYRAVRDPSMADHERVSSEGYPDCLSHNERHLTSISFYESLIICHKKTKPAMSIFPSRSTSFM